MIDKDDVRWMELCQLAAHEPDPKKLTELLAEINRILAAKQRLKGDAAFDESTGQQHSAVLIDPLSLGALGKYRVVDGPADMKRKRQLAIFQGASGQSRNQIRHKTLLGDDFRHILIIQFVGTG